MSDSEAAIDGTGGGAMGPKAMFAGVAAIAVAAFGFALWTALAQPWLGLEKAIGAEGPGVAILGTDPGGPAADIAGTRILSVEGSGGIIELTEADALEEPDVLPTRDDMLALYARQGQVHDALRAGPVTLTTDSGAFEVTAAPTRPLASLPGVFWIQMLVGLAPLLLGGWVVSLRPRDPAAWLFMFAGLGLTFVALPAGVYSTRDLALAGPVFQIGSNMNLFGSLLFGACMTSLFLIYPRRIVPLWAIWVAPAVFFLWFLGNPLGVWEGRATGGHLSTAIEMLLILLGLAAQFWVTRKDPKDRAIVRWFGASVVFGCGGFIALMAVPGAMGLEPTIRQGHAFLLFLFVYLGLTIGVARYRMFDLGNWSFKLLYYGIGVILLFAIDAALISIFALDAGPAFSAALLLVVVLYLPARDFLRTRLRPRVSEIDLGDATGAVALATTPAAREETMRNLLQRVFDPLEIERAPAPVQEPALVDEGVAMDMPVHPGEPSLRMLWTGGGRKLFAPRDRARAARLQETIARLSELARDHDAAVQAERTRINRDVHDNIGVQLLGALHSADADRKNALIRQTLTDLREIVSNVKSADAPLVEVVADLRAEVSELCDSAEVALDWSDNDLPQVELSATYAGALRAILREATGNALRHAGASRLSVVIAAPGETMLSLSVADDGRGIAADAPRGNGLDNLKHRAEALGGAFALEPRAEGGTRLAIELPILRPTPLAMAGR
ncbi:sensor histidine kinase [Jannaschia marina]|uniref:sensor histidine kinase n=1 Tax=Jannaschia marina TaxID=2741674 RepID=UPI0015CDE9C5|nr:ATP-binding protein [Jannaschia marina]